MAAPGFMPQIPPGSCPSGQTYIPPGGRFTQGPFAGSVTPVGACQAFRPPPNGKTALPSPTAFSLASIPWWGWGIAAITLFMIIMPGGRR